MALARNVASALRFVLLIVATAAHNRACTPLALSPTPSGTYEASRNAVAYDSAEDGGDIDEGKATTQEVVLHEPAKFMRYALKLLPISKFVAWTFTAMEGLTRVLSMFPSSRLSMVILPILLAGNQSHGQSPNIRSTVSSIYSVTSPPTPDFLICVMTVVTGYMIRRACFIQLGRLFTFTHTTLAEHKLVTTGPYAVVRHPSYVGMFLTRFGMLGILLSSGSWAVSSGAVSLTTWTLVPWQTNAPHETFINTMRCELYLYACFIIGEQSFLIARAWREDGTLRQQFGEEWERYRKRVPWRLIPHIL